MQDFKAEGADQNRRVQRANDKVEIQRKLVSGMKLCDPRLPEECRLLDQMRQSASAAETNRAMFRYDEGGQ